MARERESDSRVSQRRASGTDQSILSCDKQLENHWPRPTSNFGPSPKGHRLEIRASAKSRLGIILKAGTKSRIFSCSLLVQPEPLVSLCSGKFGIFSLFRFSLSLSHLEKT